LRDDPGWGVRYTLPIIESQLADDLSEMRPRFTNQVKHLSLEDKCVKRLHYFLNTSRKFPKMNVEQVDVARSQLLQRGFNTETHRLGAVSDVENLLLEVGVFPGPADAVLEMKGKKLV
jgi:hypothetical protein